MFACMAIAMHLPPVPMLPLTLRDGRTQRDLAKVPPRVWILNSPTLVLWDWADRPPSVCR